MSQFIEWVEPFDGGVLGPETVIMRMSVEDVAKWQRRREPRYASDEAAVDDFLVVHWAKRVEYIP